MFRSDLLLLVIPKVTNNRGILTGKFFEYLASQKAVLAIGPTDGDLAKIIQETKCGKMFEYQDSEGMQGFVEESLNNPETASNLENVYQYSRKQLTGKIAELLEA